jgi:hypothetical protein
MERALQFSGWSIICWAFIAFVSAADVILFDGRSEQATHSIQALVLVCPLVVCVTALRSANVWVLSPLWWFQISMATYCGGGTMAFLFMDSGTLAVQQVYYPIGPSELAWVNLLNSLGGLTVFTTTWLLLRNDKQDVAKIQVVSRFDSGSGVLLYVSSGLCILFEVFLILPFNLGWLAEDFVLPGVFNVVANLNFLWLFLLAVSRTRWNRVSQVVTFLIIVEKIAIGFLMTSKTIILTALIVWLLATYTRSRSRIRGIISVLVIAVTYFLLTPLVNEARAVLGRLGGPTVDERVAALTEAGTRLSEGRALHADLDSSQWMSRFAYSNAQIFCRDMFDSNDRGETLQLAIVAVIPRSIWPGKPNLTVGPEFNALMTGNPNAASAPGVFGEGYWNLGWPGVAVVGVWVGFVLSLFHKTTLKNISGYPLPAGMSFIGSLILGLGLMDWFASCYVGGAAASYLSVLLFEKIGRRTLSHPRIHQRTPEASPRELAWLRVGG